MRLKLGHKSAPTLRIFNFCDLVPRRAERHHFNVYSVSPKNALSMSRSLRKHDAMGELHEPSVAESPMHERIGDNAAFEPLDPPSPAEEVHVDPEKRRKRG